MSRKKGYIVPYGFADQVERLFRISGSEAVLDFLRAIEEYSLDAREPEGLDLAGQMLFEGMRKELDFDRGKYEKMVESNRRAAQRRWGNDPDASECIQVDANTKYKIQDTRKEMEEEAVIQLPLNDHTAHGVTEDEIREYSELYPAVDIMTELRKMRGWLLANPTRRKTKRGIRAFITTWLARAQDQGRPRRISAADIMSLPEVEIHI